MGFLSSLLRWYPCRPYFFLGPYFQLEAIHINRCQHSLPEIFCDSDESNAGKPSCSYEGDICTNITMHSTEQEMLSCIVVNGTLRGQTDIKAQTSESEGNDSLLSPLLSFQSISMTELPALHNLIFVTCAIALCSFLTIRYTRSPWRKLPPGPRGLPLVGNVLQPNSQLWLSFTRLKKTYGEIL